MAKPAFEIFSGYVRTRVTGRCAHDRPGPRSEYPEETPGVVLSKDMGKQDSERRCPKCSASKFIGSRPRGAVEQCLFVLGADIFRCHACFHRSAYVGTFAIPADEKEVDRTGWMIAFALAGGIAVCAAIALWTLHHFHRWPL
jgi:hypothetical protein